MTDRLNSNWAMIQLLKLASDVHESLPAAVSNIRKWHEWRFQMKDRT